MNTIIEKIRAEVNKLPEEYKGLYKQFGNSLGFIDGLDMVKKILSDLEKEEKPIEGLEKFTEKMDAWKARFSRPDDIPVKATMAFTARMFYMYPKVAREWYESLPKATQD